MSRPLEPGDLFFRLLIPAGAAGGVKTVRSIPAAGLFLVAGSAWVMRLLKEPASPTEPARAVEPASPGEPTSKESASMAEPARSTEHASPTEEDSAGEPAISRASASASEARGAATPAGAAGASTLPAINPFAAIDDKITRLVDPLHTIFPLVCVLITALGTYLTTFIVTPEIPQGSKAFRVPTQAVQFIADHPPHGNLLNLAHFGNVMMWQMKHNPPVFIDSRYNLFGNDLLQDYWHMLDCEKGWRELLDRYKIGWVFLPPQQELSKRLRSDPAWTLLYSDDASVILSRDPLDRKHP